MWKLRIIGCLVLCQVVVLPNVIWAQEEGVKVRELTLSPREESRPALKHRLQIRVYELNNDNAAVLYHSAAEQCPQDGEDNLFDKIDQWRDMPVDQWPREEVKEALDRFRATFRCLELAAMRSRCEWDMPIEEGFSMLMPSLGIYRKITYALSLKLRLEIADGRIDEALSTLTAGLAFSRGLGNGPTVIQDLVGIAIAAMMVKNTSELIGTSDAPNLYWALTELPVPFIDLRQSLSYEYDLMYWEIPELRDLDQEVLSETQASDLVNKTFKKFTEAGLWEHSDFDVLPMAWVMMHYMDAKDFLVERGMKLARIEAMPAAQAVMLYQFEEFEEVKDDMFKWLTLPYTQYREYAQEHDKALEQVMQRGFKSNLFAMYLPALSRIRFLEARLCRDIDVLRVIEALRLYAAENQGAFPQSLDDVTMVPVPVDPVTGQAFVYQFKDRRHVRLEAPLSEEKSKRRPVFELTLRP